MSRGVSTDPLQRPGMFQKTALVQLRFSDEQNIPFACVFAPTNVEKAPQLSEPVALLSVKRAVAQATYLLLHRGMRDPVRGRLGWQGTAAGARPPLPLCDSSLQRPTRAS